MALPNKMSGLIRNFASAAAGKKIKPPIQVFGVEGRYAMALYSAASRLNQLEAVEKDLIEIQTTLKTKAVLRETITSPIINRKVMAETLAATSKQANLCSATSNFLAALAENGRLKRVDGVVNSFKTIMAAHRGDVVCEVVTAKALDDSQRKQLEEALKKFIKANERIKLFTKVKPDLLGGMIVSIGDKYIDMSIASKVKLYNDLISQPA